MDRKTEKKLKTSIICPDVRCYICHTNYGLDLHHVIHGHGRRTLADEDKLFLALCRYHHTRLHDHGENDKTLQALGQRAYIEEKKKEGYSEGHARGLFLNRYGKFFD